MRLMVGPSSAKHALTTKLSGLEYHVSSWRCNWQEGREVDALRKKLNQIANGPVSVEVIEVKRPELDASLIAQSCC